MLNCKRDSDRMKEQVRYTNFIKKWGESVCRLRLL